ncbi:MAG: hypothetical protein ABI616_01240 [Pseudomonadota bacterium]
MNRYLSALAVATICMAQMPLVLSAGKQPRPDFSGVWFPDPKASGRWPTERPFTPAMAAARALWTRTYTPIDLTRDDENISCVPYTLPYVMTTITQYPFEIISTPERIYLLTEVFGQVRRIDLGATQQGDQLPSRMGLSHGHWEGSELVVETTHLLPLHVGHRFPSSRAQSMVERFSLVEGGTGKQLRVRVTVRDPLVYTQPIVVQMTYKAAPDVELGEYICGQDLWDQHMDGSSSKIPWR